MTKPDLYAEFLARECKDDEDATWLIVERAFNAGLAARQGKPVAWRTVHNDGTPMTEWIDGDGTNHIPVWRNSHIEIVYASPSPQSAISEERVIELAREHAEWVQWSDDRGKIVGMTFQLDDLIEFAKELQR